VSSEWQTLRVLDGGFGSGLQAYGYELSNDRLWSAAALIDASDLVTELHKRYIDAGCDVLLTNTYHANIATMKATRKMTDAEAEAVIAKGAHLALQAVAMSGVQRTIQIFGSVGPYATALSDGSEYNGRYVDYISEEVIVQHHVVQARPLLNAGLEMLAFETVPAEKEGIAILKALDLLPASVKCWISFSCRDGTQTNHCESFAKVVSEVTEHPKVIAVGINCTPPKYISSLLRSANSNCNGKPFVVYPNSGEQYNVETKSWSDDKSTMRSIASYVSEWKELGARLIGGCCRVLPEDIRAIADAVLKST
uniref:Hcy-binding domain-containing protein n=2 Tax=Parascaris univalens TaxID=6257 RepID=A0A915C746_PARUN